MILPLVPPGRSLIDAAADWLDVRPGVTDYSDYTVVFPGRRPAHFLRKVMAERLGSAFIPPSVLSMDEFIARAYESLADSPLIDAMDAVRILYDIQTKAPLPLGRSHFISPDSFLPLGLKLFDDIEELCIEAVTREDVQRLDTLPAEGVPAITAAGLRGLASFYGEFYDDVRGRGRSTRSLRYRAVAEADDIHKWWDAKALFAGFYALTGSESKLLRRLLKGSDVDILFQEGPGIGAVVESLGGRREVDDSRREPPVARLYSSPDVHGQVFCLSQVLADTFARGVPADTSMAVVVPDPETLFPLLHHGLPLPPDGDLNVSMGYPLSRTPLFGFVSSLMDLLSSKDDDLFYLPDYVRFLLHPYLKNILFRGSAEATRVMCHAIEDRLLANKTKKFMSLEEIIGDREFLGGIAEALGDDAAISPDQIRGHIRDIHAETVGRLRIPGTVGEIADDLIAIIMHIANNSTARLHPLFHPFAEAFITHLHALGRSLMHDLRFDHVANCLAFLHGYLGRCTVPFHGTPLKGVQVLGFLETRNLGFRHLFILDANDDVLPGTRREDSLLPFKVRKALKLPTHLDRERLSKYYFETLIRNSGEVHIFFQENAARERSRFVEALLWERQKLDKESSASRYIRHVRYRVCLDNRRPGPIPKTGEVADFLRDFVYSTSALDAYLSCPLKFYYKYVLAVGEREDLSSGGIGRADVGSLVHTILADYFRPLKGKPLTQQDLRPERMRDIVAARCADAFGTDPRGAPFLIQRQITTRMTDLLNRYYRPLIREQEVVVMDVEKAVHAAIGPFRLKGRIDMLQKRGDRIVLIDYKTSASDARLAIRRDRLVLGDRRTWPEAIGSLQLPFYMLLYEASGALDVLCLEAIYLLLGKMSSARDAVESPLDRKSGDLPLYGDMKTIILRLIAEIADREMPFEAAPDLKTACPDCAYRYLCGTQWIPAGRKL